jgi:2-polyprenyl-6-methoxyphenol hydroxylase-like FAD-dependent oxidoreductase
MEERKSDDALTDVLIVGAGPTGSVLALWLTKQNKKVRIIDKIAAPGSTSRAMAVQARTLELYRQLDLSDAVVASGKKNPAINLWVKGKKKARLQFSTAGEKLTPYPFILIFPQDQHEKLLIEKLASLGVHVERETEFLDYEDRGDLVAARLRTADGQVTTCNAAYLAGCDGARSQVRHQIGTTFEGGTYNQTFYVADVDTSGPNANGEAHMCIETADFVAVLAYGDIGQCRLIGMVGDDKVNVETLTFEDINQSAIKSMGININKVNWFSTYRVHHRVAGDYRKGRVFLLGDAAHVHSPAGGQGMNTGIGDAINLAWKLAAVLDKKAPDNLLDTYEVERKTFALKLVETTDRIFSVLTAEGNFANFVRTSIAPLAAPVAYGVKSIREYMFRVVSQTMISYHQSALSEGSAQSIQSGERLPWVTAASGDNFSSLADICWQVHVYGTASGELIAWCKSRKLKLNVFAYTNGHKEAGLVRNAAYLLRPDTYIACIDAPARPEALEKYFSARGLTV